MNSKLLLKSSLRSMSRNKLRTLFMSIGVMIGVATLIAGQSLGGGAEQELKQRVDKVFSPGSIMLVSATLTNGDIDAIEEQMEQVVASAARFGGGESEISYQGANRKAAVFGHTVEGETVWNRSVIEGRYFNNQDMSTRTTASVRSETGSRRDDLRNPGIATAAGDLYLVPVPAERPEK